MALEDFFTLTEMKDGLATRARVEELISIMQKQKDCVMNNVGDAARQWSTVANILSATENKDCLDHFIHLNGLKFLNQWLQETRKYSCDAIDGSVEELISSLLGALQKLPVNKEKLISSGIGFTVKQLLGHRGPNAQERARILLGNWDLGRDGAFDCEDLDKHEPNPDDELKDDSNKVNEEAISTHPVLDTSTTKEGVDESHGIESADNRRPEGSEADMVKDAEVSVSNQSTLQNNSTLGDANVISGDANSLVSSSVSNHENMSATEESCVATETTFTGTCSSPVATEKDVHDQPDSLQTKVAACTPMEIDVETDTKENSLFKPNQKESTVSSSSGLLSSSPKQVQKSSKEPSVIRDPDSKEAESGPVKTSEPQQSTDTVDFGLPKYMRTTKELEAAVKDLSGGKLESPGTPFHGVEVPGAGTNIKEIGSSYLRTSKGPVTRTPSSSLKQKKGTNNTSKMDKRRSEIGLEYGDDALEVAVQVAIEAKREVADRERRSSSPEGNSEGEIMDSGSSELEENKFDQPKPSKSSSQVEHSEDDSSPRENSSRTIENIDADPRDSVQELESPKSTLVKKSVENVEKNKCSFDLNEDICTEDADYQPIPTVNHQSNLSAPVAVFPTSKGAPGLPSTPLHFKGELGWRGSAATSAFRPASPRRTPDGEKTVSGSKILEIDLNIAEADDDVAVQVFDKQIPVSSGLPSGESSMEVSSTKAERLKLDLNRVGDESAFPNSSAIWKLHQQNGSASPASSSSTRQPSMRNFDLNLNDNPSFFDASGPPSLDRSSKEVGTYGSFKLDGPAVTIMGSRMSMERKEHIGQTHLPFLANGWSMEPTMGARPSVPYPHMPAAGYGYNGLAVGPAISLPPALYGPGSMPYMVDSRGATVVPQILGPSSASSGPLSSRPPFLVNVAGAHPGLGAVGGCRPSLDLNTGAHSMDSGSREMGSFSQLFMQGHSGLTEEQTRAASQPSAGSSIGLKRKEPDRGWESYPIGYKQG